MRQCLANKHILLGVTGSVAAYKSADLVRRLRDAGALVRVVMTENAKRFITPLTMQAVSGHPVHDDLFDRYAEAAMGHIELARWADVILIAPATAHLMAKLAYGDAGDLLTTLCLATKSPIVLVPAMNQGMWQHIITQENRAKLSQQHIHFFGPSAGSQACGDVGPGRMMEPLDIIDQLNALFATGALAGLNLLITAGPTHEAIDPVRFITNASSGKMGYALAEAAREAGANVTLVSGPVHLPKPSQVTCLDVITANEMAEAVMKKVSECDIFLAVAAVSDYRPAVPEQQKIHKHEQIMNISLTRNPDIVSEVGRLAHKPFIVGFAAETEDVQARARAKRQQKQMDMIIANRVGKGVGIMSDENSVTVITGSSEIEIPETPKPTLARLLIDLIAKAYKQSRNTP